METADYDSEYPGEVLDQNEEWIRLVADEMSEAFPHLSAWLRLCNQYQISCSPFYRGSG